MLTLFALFAAFQVKHFLADYPFQTRWMAGKFDPGWGFISPLAAHAGVHAAMTLGIVWYFDPAFWWLAGIDGASHFIMDRIKASPRLMGRWKPLTSADMKLYERGLMGDFYIEGGRYITTPESFRMIRGNRMFWIALGLDQMVHHLTHYGIIAVLLLHFN